MYVCVNSFFFPKIVYEILRDIHFFYGYLRDNSLLCDNNNGIFSYHDEDDIALK